MESVVTSHDPYAGQASTTGPRVEVIPTNHNVTGTCGKCGGPIVQAMLWVGGIPAPEHCNHCGARPKPIVNPAWGPLRDMA